jgi:O-antigen ligase/Tfp pilus assembly protein PilF
VKFKLLFIILYLIVGLVPYFGAIDKVYPQILYLSILNLFSFIFVIKKEKRNSLKALNKVSNNWSLLLYFLFLFWSLITILFSINKLESVYTINEIFVQLSSFLFILYFLSKINNLKNTFLYIIISLIIIDCAFVLIPYFSEIYLIGSPTQRGMIYRGYTGNINILAYIMLIKYPFLIYFNFIKKGNFKFNFILKCIITFIITSIFATRSAIISLLTISALIYLLTYIYNRHVQSNYKIRSLFKIIFLPLIIAFLLNNIQTFIFNTGSVQSRLATFSNISADFSLDSRFKYYSSAIQSFLEKPLFGKGIGSWEYESIKYAKEDLTDYVVPYHAHNDYLEILAETGFLGFVLYFGIIIIPLIYLFKYFFNKNTSKELKLFSVFFIASLVVYLIDSMFNFPFDRAVQQIHLAFILATIIILFKFKFSTLRNNNFIFIIILSLIPLSILASSRYFIQATHQNILITQFNRSDFSKPPLDEINRYDYKSKNLSATALPLSVIRGLYHLKNDKPEEALNYFRDGIKANPYIYISESFLGYTFDVLGQRDSAIVYTKQAFENLPKNAIHYANYINSLVQFRDSLKIKEIYNSIENKANELYAEVYLLAMSQITDPSNSQFTLDNIEFDFQSGSDRLKKGYYVLQVGEDNMYIADYNYQLGLEYFENGNFNEAYKSFKAASEINPFEYSYKENTANTLLRLGRDDDALVILNQMINEDKNYSPKSFYLRGLVLYDKNKKLEACHDLKIANDAGILGDSKIYERLCIQF